MKRVAIIQARLSSTRLPGKVLADIAGRPVLAHVLSRTAAAGVCDEIVVAISDDPADDLLEDWCRAEELPVFRGSLNDVLDRYYRAAVRHDAGCVVRVTSDCPLLDPTVLARIVETFDPARHDYVSNTIERTYPDGLDTEVFTFDALERAWRDARLGSEREHVTPFIWKNPGRFRIEQITQAEDRSAERWTVDEARDLEFVRAVFAEIGQEAFGQDDVLDLLDRRPELREINAGIPLNEGYAKSLREDAE